jgi:TPR repeat protein
MRWLESSARQRNTPAEYQLGVLRERAEDSAGAFKWYARAAAGGHAASQKRVGLAYRDGDGVGVDPHAAAKLLEAAALQGDRDAAFLAGTVHGKSLGDMAAAAKWFEHAANAGHAAAAANLGTFYARGIGVKASKSAALNWFLVAASLGHETAAQIAEGLAQEIASSDEEEGAVKASTESQRSGTLDNGGDSSNDDSQALYELGMAYLAGRAAPEVDPITNREFVNRTHGLVFLQRAASTGHTGAALTVRMAGERANIS